MTTIIEALCNNYASQVGLAWQPDLAGPQRVWFVVYPPAAERRLRLRLQMFEAATQSAGKRWKHRDLTGEFSEWMAYHRYRDDYFGKPTSLGLGLKQFQPAVADHVRSVLADPDADSSTVVALSGIGSLFGLASVSQLISDVTPSIRGRLLVFFPGHTEHGLFKLLDATAGYNYLAVAITADDGEYA
jgi:hypothetical protein